MNEITLINKDNKFTINKKISINVSSFLKKIVEDTGNDEILLYQFNDLEIKIFQDYISHLSKNNYNYNEYYKTIEYYMGENKNKNITENCSIINDFINNIIYPHTEHFYKLVHFLDIELLQEILIKFNLKIIINNNLTKIDDDKNLCSNLNEEKIKLEEEFKKFISNNDDLEIYEDALDKLSNKEEEEEEENNEPLKKKSKLIEKFPKEINNNIKNYNTNLELIKKKINNENNNYINECKKKMTYIKNQLDKYGNKIEDGLNKLKLKIKNYIKFSNNIFVMGNLHFCSNCKDIWYFTNLISNYHEKNKDSECELCNENHPYIEDIENDILHILLNKFNFKSNKYDKNDYIEPINEINSIEDIYQKFIDNDYGGEDNFFYLEDKCMECHLGDNEYITCEVPRYIFNYDIQGMACGKTFCREHFGNNVYTCSYKDCDNETSLCKECYCSNDHLWDKFRYEEKRSICNHCRGFHCKKHTCGQWCIDCRRDDY